MVNRYSHRLVDRRPDSCYPLLCYPPLDLPADSPTRKLSFQTNLPPALIRHSSLPRICKGCALSCPDPREVHQSEKHLLHFQSLPFTPISPSLEGHSLCVYPGRHQERSVSCRLSAVGFVSPLSATLMDDLRVLPCFGRSCPPATPLDATLTDSASVNPLSATLTKNRGGGGTDGGSRLFRRKLG